MSSFRPQPIATVAMLFGVAVLIGLGTWQLQRRAWKIELIDAVEARATKSPRVLRDVLDKYRAGNDQRYAKVTVQGEYDHSGEFHVFGTLGPVPGYYIFTLFNPSAEQNPSTGASKPFFVNRGFVPQDLKSVDTRASAQVDGNIELTGLFRMAERKPTISRWVSPANLVDQNIWYTRNPAEFVAQSANRFPSASPQDVRVQTEWYIDSSGNEIGSQPYPEGSTTRIDFNNRHLEYAFTWFGLAATLFGVWAAFSVRRKSGK